MRAGYRCARCHGAGRLEVHHQHPVHLGGAEHDPANVSVLCRPCHLITHRAEHRTSIARSAWRREVRSRVAASKRVKI